MTFKVSHQQNVVKIYDFLHFLALGPTFQLLKILFFSHGVGMIITKTVRQNDLGRYNSQLSSNASYTSPLFRCKFGCKIVEAVDAGH